MLSLLSDHHTVKNPWPTDLVTNPRLDFVTLFVEFENVFSLLEPLAAHVTGLPQFWPLLLQTFHTLINVRWVFVLSFYQSLSVLNTHVAGYTQLHFVHDKTQVQVVQVSCPTRIMSAILSALAFSSASNAWCFCSLRIFSLRSATSANDSSFTAFTRSFNQPSACTSP